MPNTDPTYQSGPWAKLHYHPEHQLWAYAWWDNVSRMVEGSEPTRQRTYENIHAVIAAILADTARTGSTGFIGLRSEP